MWIEVPFKYAQFGQCYQHHHVAFGCHSDNVAQHEHEIVVHCLEQCPRYDLHPINSNYVLSR
ncbi:unnamed protein product, partial [Nesidiocoris tenuis]